MKEVTRTGVHAIGATLRGGDDPVVTSGYADLGTTTGIPNSTVWPQSVPCIPSNTIPYTPPPATTWVTTLTTTPTFEEKAELVLAILIGGIDDEDSVLLREATDQEADDNDAAAVAYINDPTVAGTLVLITKENSFYEIVEALYDQLTSLRGRQLR